jgi:hypothetical protein
LDKVVGVGLKYFIRRRREKEGGGGRRREKEEEGGRKNEFRKFPRMERVGEERRNSRLWFFALGKRFTPQDRKIV